MKRFLFGAVILMTAACIVLSAVSSAYVVPILMYHNIGQQKDILSVPPEAFLRHMKFLRDYRYNVISLGELVDLMAENKQIPAKTVVVTFDDGRDNNYTNAFPILKEYGIPATMFVIPNHSTWEGYLTKPQLKEMAASGIDIGSHTLNDVWLPGCNDKKLTKEIAGSKKALERIIAKRVDFISYPLGGFDQRVRMAVMKAGFKGACATNPGRYSADNDIYVLKRLKISGRNANNMLAFWFKTTGYAMWFKEHKRKK